MLWRACPVCCGEYEEGGVPEYWRLDQSRRQAEFNLLGLDGRYHLAPIGEDGIFHSRVLPGFWLKVEWLWQDPLPSVREVLRELGVE
jgi:Uma2 family endonuclease